MSGPLPKPADRRQRRNKAPELAVLEGGKRSVEVPACPRGLLKLTESQWDVFWQSAVAATVAGSDMPALRRLFTLMDERERAHRACKEQRLVIGSQGQPVLNPLFKVVAQCDGEIRQLEDRFGISPRARLALGLQAGEYAARSNDMKARKPLDNLNELLAADIELSEDDYTEVDDD